MLNDVTFILLSKFKDTVASAGKRLGIQLVFKLVISKGFMIA